MSLSKAEGNARQPGTPKGQVSFKRQFKVSQSVLLIKRASVLSIQSPRDIGLNSLSNAQMTSNDPLKRQNESFKCINYHLTIFIYHTVFTFTNLFSVV